MTKLQIDTGLLTQAFTNDSRIASLALPYLLQKLGYMRVPAGGGGWLAARDGIRLKIRVMNKQGVAFGPSVAKGAGRAASSSNWDQGVNGISGFLVYDSSLDAAGEIHTWVVPLDTIEQLRKTGEISADGTISRFAMQLKLREF